MSKELLQIRPVLRLLVLVILALSLNPVESEPVQANGTDLIITGVIDGPLSGGLPKAVEFYVLNDIPDLSIYGVGSATNGNGSDGQEFDFPGDSATAGSFIYVATESTEFDNFFDFAPDYTDGNATLINGDDAIELFMNGSVVDVFGDINVDGTGETWEYLDGWAYRRDGTGPDGTTFVQGNWSFSGPNALDEETVNDTAATQFPIGTYSAATTAITLAAFEVEANNGRATIAWETGTEIDNAGFNLYRATAPEGPWLKINSSLILAEGNPVTGAEYSFVDRPGRGTFYYQLEDVDDNGVPTLHEPVMANLGPAIRIPWFRPLLQWFGF